MTEKEKQILEERFLKKVEKIPFHECWEWVGATRAGPYGSFRLGKTATGAHRVSYRLFVGPIPDRMLVLHSCDNPPCVNPNHLFLGTDLDNAMDKIKKGRGLKKLTQIQIEEMTSKYQTGTYLQRELATEYGVNQHTVWYHLSRASQ